MYGISRDPGTKDYIMIFQDVYCEKCGEQYTDSHYVSCNWCKQCVINHLKTNFTSWTSGNKDIDNYIQEMQLQFNDPDNIVFEWIPYSQFNNIKEISKTDFATIYSALWKDGPLNYDENEKELIRGSNTKVILKNLHNSQNFTYEFINEVMKLCYFF